MWGRVMIDEQKREGLFGSQLDEGSLEVQFRGWLADHGLMVDAHEAFRCRNGLPANGFSLTGIKVDFPYELSLFSGRRSWPKLEVDTMIEGHVRKAARSRRERLVANLIGKPSTEEGRAELRRWLEALFPSVDDVDYAVWSHWLWTVKATLAGRRNVPLPLMINVTGAQGAGKSWAVRRLCEPLEELALPNCDAALLTDERKRLALTRYNVAVWDELGGLDRADSNALKSTLTSEELEYRPMRQNSSQAIANCCRFIGTSNESVSYLMADTTGARRFYEMECRRRAEFHTMQEIRPEIVWQAVSELEPDPINGFEPELSERQMVLVPVDTVACWLGEEDWYPLGVCGEARIDPSRGLSYTQLRERYSDFSRRTGHAQAMLGASAFRSRLKQEGWETSKACGRTVYRLPAK